jgi:hypothetical protein
VSRAFIVKLTALPNFRLAMRQEHKAGEKAFVDWAGATIAIHDPATGQSVAGAAVRNGIGRQFLRLG